MLSLGFYLLINIVKDLVNKSYKLYLKSSKCIFNNSFVLLIIVHPLIHKNTFNKLVF